MRFAIVTDVHGDVSALRIAIEEATRIGFDELVSMGDLVDFTTPAEPLSPAEERRLHDVTNWDKELAHLTAEAHLLRGNQEEKARAYLGRSPCPAEERRILNAPLFYYADRATFTHGHLYMGTEVEPDRWVPLDAEFSTQTLFHGHHHRNSIIRVGDDQRRWRSNVDTPFASGVPVALEDDERYIINVGPAQGARPSWALFDDRHMTVTMNYATIRLTRRTQ